MYTRVLGLVPYPQNGLPFFSVSTQTKEGMDNVCSSALGSLKKMTSIFMSGAFLWDLIEMTRKHSYVLSLVISFSNINSPFIMSGNSL
jgi:hypothetical protein